VSGRGHRFVILLGWVSLFADLCHEGMRSAIGPYLASLGASATAVGAVAGTGELLGFGLRYATGALADRTGAYWGLTIAGYLTNLIAIPLLALAGSWPAVAALVGLERLGKAVRSPAKSTLTSFAAKDVGAGRAFAISEAMDQAGGLMGPLLVAGILAWRGFGTAFVLLGIPAVLTLAILFRARQLYPDPSALDDGAGPDDKAPLGPHYRLYLVGVALIALGLADWPLLAYHLTSVGLIAAKWTPIAYACAMAMDGIVAVVAGTLFDRVRARGRTGGGVIALFVLVGAGYAPLVLGASSLVFAIIGIALWSIARSATESIGKAMIAAIVPKHARGRAYGLYYLIYGIAWFVGSIGLGALYDHSPMMSGIAASAALAAGALVVAISARRARA
jgi:MFS family permease